ncbi:hypothetical protein Tco_1243067 [Tanacetum coccineum]
MDIREELRLSKMSSDDISDIVVLKEFVIDSVVNLMRFCCESHVIVISSLGVKGRRGSDSPKKGRVPMSERFLNPTPITQYNPVTNEVVKESGKEKPDVVVVNEKLDVVNENPDVVKEKPDFVKENPASVKEKPAVVKEALRYSRKVDKEAVVKNKLSLGKSNVPTKLHKDKVDKEVVADKASVQDDPGNSSSVVVSKDKRKGVNDKVLDVVAKDKPKGSASSVVVSKDKRKESSEKEDKALNVFSKDKPKVNASSELPNKKERADIPKGKHKVHSEVPVLRSKPKSEVKAKASVCKRILSKEDHSKKKPEVDYDSSSDEVNSFDEEDHSKKQKKLKRKRNDSDSDSFDEEDHSKKQKKLKRKRNDSDSDSLSIDRETIKRMINKLQKKVKKESDKECVPRKGKNKEKQLTPKEAAYQEYLSTFPSFHARTTPISLFSAIRNSSVDMLQFLNDIGFSSLNNVFIDKLLMKLGWFVVSRFKNYKLSFDTGDQIKVTRSKIHDMVGIPVGGYFLLKLDERETSDEFVKEWADPFSPIALKKIRVNDIDRNLVESQEIDFLFKVNFLTLFTNTMCKADGLKGEF